MSFRGIYQILHTPFDESGTIDWASFEQQISFSIKAGVHGLVAPAMASEFYTLSDKERFEVVEFAAQHINKRVPYIVAVQGVSLKVACEFAEHAVGQSADGLMAMPPYLRKSSKAGLREYYSSLANFGLPLMIQNAPAPIGSPLSPAEMSQLLAENEQLSYIKEESPPILQKIAQIKVLAGEHCLGIFGGANGLYLLDEMARGACGNMPAGGLVDLQVKTFNAFEAGEKDKANDLQLRLLPLLTYASMYGATFHKYLLWRRGVFKSPYARDPQKIDLDKGDIAAIESYWTLVENDVTKGFELRESALRS